jgi:hypothetical protein
MLASMKYTVWLAAFLKWLVDLTLAISNQQQALATKRKLDVMDAPTEDADNTENISGKRRANERTCGSALALLRRTNVNETSEEGSYWDSPEAKIYS